MSTTLRGGGEMALEQHPLLDSLISQLEEEDTWDGDNPGLEEDKAHATQEAIEKIKELKVLLEELDITY